MMGLFELPSRPVVGLVICLCLVGCSIGRGSAPTPTATPVYAPKPLASHFVHLLDTHRFDPAQLQGQAGELVELVLVGDKQKHDFTSPDLNVNIDVPAGQVEIIQVELPSRPGSYEFWSAQPGDREAGMVGHFEVLGQPR
jgi:Cupredoxin-like domain